MDLRRSWRVARRLALGAMLLPVLAVGVAAQMAIIGPFFKKNTTVQRLSSSAARRLLGIKVEFNKESAPLVQDRPVWFLGNHQSQADVPVMGSVLNTAFAGKGNVMKSRFLAPMAKSVHLIGLRRVPKNDPQFRQFQDEAYGKVCRNFNEGRNLTTFQEGTTTDGSEIRQFRAGLLKTLFTREGRSKSGEAIFLDRMPVVQPIGIKVLSVEGVSAEGRDDLRHFYSHYTTDASLKHILTRLATKEIVIELKAFDPLHVEDFADEKELANKACDLIRSYVVPHQTDVRPAEIPNIDKPAGETDNSSFKPPRL